jgi:hypothetical protein
MSGGFSSIIRGIFVLALWVMAGVVFGQHFNTRYGQNRIQYQNFDWKFYRTSSFDVYYYKGGEAYARDAVQFLEKEYAELTDKIGYAPYTKPKILIYNSIHDLQQSNIGIGGDVYTIGGKTNFIKLEAQVAYPGQAHQFRQELMYSLSKILIADMMYGGSLGEIFQNAYLLSLPEWFIDGAARYLAYGWSEEMDTYIRDYLGRKRIRKIVKVNDQEAGIVGQSIWNYIANVYGESNISNILNLTRIIRREQNSITATLGINYNAFLANWQNFYILQKEEVIAEYVPPKEEDMVSHKRAKELIRTTIRVSPEGDKVAFSRIRNGQYYVYVRDLKTHNTKKITAGGYRINNQEVDKYLPLLDWQDAQTLGVIVFRRGNLFLDTYNLETNEKRRKPMNRFNQIKSFSFNDNGRLAVVSGDIDGKNDLFLISMRRNDMRRITNDVYDDMDPMFIPGTAAIVFSSNRTNDSLKIKNIPLSQVTDNFNLFLYDLDTTKHSVYRLTNTYSADRKPIPKNEYFIYYLSDQKGITNLFRLSLLDTTFHQVTKFDKGLDDYDINFAENALSFIMLDKGFHKVYVNNSTDLESDNFTMPTPRQNAKQQRFLFARRNQPKKDFEVELPIDSTEIYNPMEPDKFVFEREVPVGPAKRVKDGYIDTDNYVFGDEVTTGYEPDSFFSNYKRMQRQLEKEGPFIYEPRFSFGNITTSFAIDPLRGFGIVLQTEVVDMMENYRFIGGGFLLTSFTQADLFGEVQYLPYWTDFHLRMERKGYLFESFFFDGITQRYVLSNIEAGVSVPWTHSLRGTLAPFYASTRFTNLNYNAVLDTNPNEPRDNITEYLGVRAAVVYDNSLERGFNIRQGTRGLMEYKRYEPISEGGKYFHQFKMDVRHYQRIHREITLAGRFFYGSFWGANQPNYLLGGVDNWLFNRGDFHGQNDPLFPIDRNGNQIRQENSNILFTEFVTNLRGFDYAEMFGHHAMVFNAEFRFPLFRYLIRRPISSNFLRNFQITQFYDIGSAWSGRPPFTRRGAFEEEEYSPGGPFTGKLTNFRNPWLAGYGYGIRTTFLGYYLKIDRAKPIRDFEVGGTRWYISLGVDF